MKTLVTKTTILNQGDATQKRAEILEYFRKTVAIEEKLFETFKNVKTYYLRSDPLRHPLIFYYGHTAVFYINKLVIAKLLNKRINPRFESIFAVGVDEMSWDDLNEEHYDWPDVAEVREYRQKVWNLVEEKIKNLPLKIPINWDEPFWAIMMGIEHQRIHLETSSVLIRQLPLSAIRVKDFWKICTHHGKSPENSLIPVDGGKVVMGKNYDDPLYGWDNEFGYQEVQVKDFKAGKFLVSNGEFREFVDDNGYKNREFWTDEGWKWKQYTKAEQPFFWRKEKENIYRLRIMLEEIPMPWNWPVVVNYLEAKAFCNWKSRKTGKTIRLPMESEWYRLRDNNLDTDQPYWKIAPGNINLEHYASCSPVDEFKFGDFYDVIGNVWQWTETPFSGFDGFKVHPYYDDFSTPTFDGKHNLIKGGSWISTGNEAIRNSRYAFRRHFFQHAGFRYIESNEPVNITTKIYEEDPEVTIRCEFNYGKEYFEITNFSKNAAKFCLNNARNKKTALNLGCDVGRTTFELAKEFEHVVGLDFSARHIKVAIQMQESGKVLYTLPEEGDLISYNERSLDDLGLLRTSKKVEFWQADPSNPKPQFRDFDLIYIQNTLERIYDPLKLLNLIHERINRNGILIISSIYDWNKEYTKEEHWLGGYRKDGEPVWTSTAVKDILEPNFKELNVSRDIRFIKRLNARKYEMGVAEFKVWQKR